MPSEGKEAEYEESKSEGKEAEEGKQGDVVCSKAELVEKVRCPEALLCRLLKAALLLLLLLRSGEGVLLRKRRFRRDI